MIIGIIAVLILGPDKLPRYAAQLAGLVRHLRRFIDNAKSRLTEEMGPEFAEVEWKKLDPRQYDPRRIIRDALLESPQTPESSQQPGSEVPTTRADNRAGTPYDSEAT